MAENYVSKTGLRYFWNRIKTVFASKTELSDLSDRVDAFPMYQFSMNGQKTMRVGYRTSGTENKAFTNISGAMLLKHR